MKYLKRFNESLNEYWDLEEIKDIFQDILDEGFKIEDVKIGSSITISPKLWCNTHRDFSGNKTFKSLTIEFESIYNNFQYSGLYPKYDLSILDVLDECIKHFERYYGVKLDSIYTIGLNILSYYNFGAKRYSDFNWFNSCETIKDINKVYNEDLKKQVNSNSPHLTQSDKDKLASEIDKLTLRSFDLIFDLTK